MALDCIALDCIALDCIALDCVALDCVAPAWATPAFAGLGAGSSGHPIVKSAIAQSRVRVPRIGSFTIALTSGGVNTTPPSVACNCEGETISGGCGYLYEPFAYRGRCTNADSGAGPP